MRPLPHYLTLNTPPQIVPCGSCVTMDWRTDRVRIFTDKDGKVAKDRVPRTG